MSVILKTLKRTTIMKNVELTVSQWKRINQKIDDTIFELKERPLEYRRGGLPTTEIDNLIETYDSLLLDIDVVTSLVTGVYNADTNTDTVQMTIIIKCLGATYYDYEGNKDDVCEAFVQAINNKISEVIKLEIPSYKL